MASSINILSDNEDGSRPNKKFKLTNVDIGSQGNFPSDFNIPSDSIILCLEKLPDNENEDEPIYDSSEEPEIKIELNETNLIPDPLNINFPEKSNVLPQKKCITSNPTIVKFASLKEMEKNNSPKQIILNKNFTLQPYHSVKTTPGQMLNKKVLDNSNIMKATFSSPMKLASKGEMNSPCIIRKNVDSTQLKLKPYKPNTTVLIPRANIATLTQLQSPATTNSTKPLQRVMVVNNKSAIISSREGKSKEILTPRLAPKTISINGSNLGTSTATSNRVNQNLVNSRIIINPKQGGVLNKMLTDKSISQDVRKEPSSSNLGKSTNAVSSKITVNTKQGGILKDMPTDKLISQDLCIEQNSSNLEKSSAALNEVNQNSLNTKLSSNPQGEILKEMLTDQISTQDIGIEQDALDVEDSLTTYTIVEKNVGDSNVNKESNSANTCVVSGCEAISSYYFEVPEGDKIFRIWKYCLKNQRIKPGDLVCEQHFIPEDIISKPKDHNIGILKDHAVPSLIRIERGCCIPQCLNKDKNAPNMYCIPIWGHFTPWINCMGELAVKVKNVHDLLQYRVCELHFSKDQLEHVFGMIPTLFLPSKNYYEAQLQNYLKNREPALKKTNDFLNSPTSRIHVPHPTTKIFSRSADLVEAYCAYEGCNLDKKYIHVQFYKFPEHYATALLWLEACRRMDILHRSMTGVQKFIQSSIGVCFIHKNIVDKFIQKKQQQTLGVVDPTKKVPDVETVVDLTEGEEPDTLNENRESNQDSDNAPAKVYIPTREYCAFINCSTQIKDLVKKYRFPADPELLAHWIKAAGISQTLPEDHLRSLFVCGKHFNEHQYNESGTLMLSAVPAPHIDYVDITSHSGNEHWVLKQKKTLVPAVPVRIASKGTKGVGASSTTTIDLLKTQVPAVPVRIASKGSKDIGAPNTTTIDLVSDEEPLPDVICTSSIPAPINSSTAEVFVDPNCIVEHCPSKKPDNKLYPFPTFGNAPAKHQLWLKAVTDSPAVVTSKYYLNKMICDRHFEKKYINEYGTLTVDAVPTIDLVEQKTQDSGEKDTSITWSECTVEAVETGETNDANYCPKMGINRFPFKLARMRRQIKGQLESVNVGHRVQIHTAIVVDDDDESEKDALELITKVLLRNSQVIPKRQPRKKAVKIKV